MIEHLDTSAITLEAQGHRFPRMEDFELSRSTIGDSILFFPRLPFPCDYCGAWPSVDRERHLPRDYREGDPITLVVGDEPCPYTDEVAITRVTIPVPSGRLVMADILPMSLTIPKAVDDLDINASLNLAAHSRAWGELGVSWTHVGNTSPNLYRRPDGTLMVGWSPQVEDQDWDGEPESFDPVLPGWENLGGVITDVWSCTMMDLGTYFAHGGQETDRWGHPLTIAEVEPGNYEFTNFTNQRSFDLSNKAADGSTVFTEVRWVPEGETP